MIKIVEYRCSCEHETKGLLKISCQFIQQINTEKSQRVNYTIKTINKLNSIEMIINAREIHSNIFLTAVQKK